jgi:hypothetical protein
LHQNRRPLYFEVSLPALMLTLWLHRLGLLQHFSADIGEFKEVEHSIDTGSAEPIRQRLRRTPISFAEEEEKLLGKMLDAKLIEPFILT